MIVHETVVLQVCRFVRCDVGEDHGSQARGHYAQVHVRCYTGVPLTVFRTRYVWNITEERVEWDGAAGIFLFRCRFVPVAILVEG